MSAPADRLDGRARGRPREGGPPHVHAVDTAVVTARSRRRSQVLTVRCAHCGPDVFHLHRAPLAFAQGRRSCPVTHKPYLVTSGVLGVLRAVEVAA